MKRSLLAAVLLVFSAGAVLAQADAIAQRRALMKANGKAAGELVRILKGAPFDLATVQGALKTFANSASNMPALFPEDSKTGGDTAALPAIWEHKTDFDARFAKFGAEANAALVAVKDEASFKANIPAIFKNCGGCHETYRAKKD